MRIVAPDLVTNSYFPALAAGELGFFRAEGLEGRMELLYPSKRAMEALRDGAVDFVAATAHTALTVFPGWEGAKLLMALVQGTPWLLVLRSDLGAKRGDVQAVKGLRIGAAPGPDAALRRLLAEAGIDPERDGVRIAAVPGADAPGASFGVTAAAALEARHLDGFWANALGSETAVRRGVGAVILDVRRGDPPSAARDFTFAALVTADAKIARDPGQVAVTVRAIVKAQRALRADPTLAAEVGRRRFPADAAEMIQSLVERDLPFYEPAISAGTVAALNRFTRAMRLLAADVGYEQVVAARFRDHWKG